MSVNLSALSQEDVNELAFQIARQGKIEQVAKAEGVPVATMTKLADQYINTADGIVLPITDGYRPAGFNVNEPLIPTVVDGRMRPVGSVVAGSGVFTPTGNAAADLALQVVANSRHLAPPTSPAVVEALVQAGHTPPSPTAASAESRPAIYTGDDPLGQLRQDVAVYAAQPATPPVAPPPGRNRSVMALIWPKGTNRQYRLRCKRVFSAVDGAVPLVVMVVIKQSEIDDIPMQTPLVLNLVPFDEDKPPLVLNAMHLGIAFTDVDTDDRYLCMAILPEEEQGHDEGRPTGSADIFGDPGPDE